MTKKEIGVNLEKTRIVKGLSKYEVAKRANLKISQIGVLEAGEKNYTIDSLIAYTNVLELSLLLSE